MSRAPCLSIVALLVAAIGLSACGRRPGTLYPPGTEVDPATGAAVEDDNAQPPPYPRSYPTY